MRSYWSFIETKFDLCYCCTFQLWMIENKNAVASYTSNERNFERKKCKSRRRVREKFSLFSYNSIAYTIHTNAWQVTSNARCDPDCSKCQWREYAKGKNTCYVFRLPATNSTIVPPNSKCHHIIHTLNIFCVLGVLWSSMDAIYLGACIDFRHGMFALHRISLAFDIIRNGLRFALPSDRV